MAWRKRDQNDEPESVELVVAGTGVLVQGTPSAVMAYVDQVTTLVSSNISKRVLADGLAVAGSIAALVNTHREYFEFSPRAMKLLREHGAIPTKDGFNRSFVRSGPAGNSPFAGHLDWRPVSLGPDQALAAQTMLATLALRAAIQDLAAAVERVEGKVDKLVTLARAERVGHAAGDRRTLQALVDRVRSQGRISSTDWSTVASLGPLIARDIEALRAYVQREISDIDDVTFAHQRSAELEELTNDLIKESLALLIVAEQNYVLWQELRVAHVATFERRRLDETVEDVRERLAALTEADQALLDSLQQATSKLLNPSGFEGFNPITRRRLHDHGVNLDETMAWFARERLLDRSALEIELPTLRESFDNARAALAEGVDTAGTTIRSLVSRRSDDQPAEPSEIQAET